MIVTCPSCATRHDFRNALMAPGDVRITCKSCGHRWIEIDGSTVADVSRGRLPPPRWSEPRREEEEVSDADIQRLVAAARDARASFAEKQQQGRRRTRAWGGFALFALAPIVAAGVFPEQVVSAAPAALIAYEKLGVDVNIYGLDIRRIEQQHAIVKGARVLSVKGEIVNTANNVQKIPWLRFALQDSARKEVYHWTLDTESRPLRPGEATTFVTRIQAPPEAARDLQIRFARMDEIGQKAAP